MEDLTPRERIVYFYAKDNARIQAPPAQEVAKALGKSIATINMQYNKLAKKGYLRHIKNFGFEFDNKKEISQ